jgi:hypothetical protein
VPGIEPGLLEYPETQSESSVITATLHNRELPFIILIGIYTGVSEPERY